MELVTNEIRKDLPPLYSMESESDPTLRVKFFTPDANWTWYAIEFDGDDLFFGLVIGLETELEARSIYQLREICTLILFLFHTSTKCDKFEGENTPQEGFRFNLKSSFYLRSSNSLHEPA